MGDHRWSGHCHQSQQIHVSSAFSLLRVFCQQFMSQKNVFMTRYLHKQVKNIASINTSWYLQCIHFCIGPAQKPQRKVRASYFYCQHILYCPSRCQAGKWEEAKMLWNSIFADLFCSGVDFAVIARVWCHSQEEIQKSSEKILIYPHFILCQKWMLQQPRALLWLINPDSFDEIIRQRGEILVTVSEFMTVLPLANVTQLQNSAGLMLSLDWVVSVTNIIPDSRQLM